MSLNPFTTKDVLTDFTLSNARRFLLVKGRPLSNEGVKSKGDPLVMKGLTKTAENQRLNWRKPLNRGQKPLNRTKNGPNPQNRNPNI